MLSSIFEAMIQYTHDEIAKVTLYLKKNNSKRTRQEQLWAAVLLRNYEADVSSFGNNYDQSILDVDITVADIAAFRLQGKELDNVWFFTYLAQKFIIKERQVYIEEIKKYAQQNNRKGQSGFIFNSKSSEASTLVTDLCEVTHIGLRAIIKIYTKIHEKEQRSDIELPQRLPKNYYIPVAKTAKENVAHLQMAVMLNYFIDQYNQILETGLYSEISDNFATILDINTIERNYLIAFPRSIKKESVDSLLNAYRDNVTE